MNIQYRRTVAAWLIMMLVPFLAAQTTVKEYPVPSGSHPHDVAPAPDGRVWYTAQNAAALGVLDPDTGHTRHIPLGSGSRPHGVIVGPDGGIWVTDSGLNAIVRVDPRTGEIKRFALPSSARNANLNTATFGTGDMLWFTGQNGYYGRLNIKSGEIIVRNSPRGRGPYGIDAAPDGTVYFVSLAGSYLGRIHAATAEVTVIEPPTPGQGLRRVWADSKGILWITGWNSGMLLRYDPTARAWEEIGGLGPDTNSRPYSVYVDERDKVWISVFASNTMQVYDPATRTFEVFGLPSANGGVRQMLGRPGEVWGAESGADKLIVFRYSGK